MLLFSPLAMTPEECQLELVAQKSERRTHTAPILFVHGAFHGAWCWTDHFMPWFAEHGYNSYAISLRDHGRSLRTQKHEQWRLSDYVADVQWAIAQLDAKPILVGHSLGAAIVQKLIAKAEFSAMVLLAPSPIGGSNRAALRMMRAHPGPMFRALSQRNLALALPAYVDFFLSPDLAPAQAQHVIERLDGLTSFASAMDAFFRDPPSPQRTNTATLVLSGTNDWSIPHYKNKRLAAAYGGEHDVVDTAHDMMCDSQWAQVATRILRFLKQSAR